MNPDGPSPKEAPIRSRRTEHSLNGVECFSRRFQNFQFRAASQTEMSFCQEPCDGLAGQSARWVTSHPQKASGIGSEDYGPFSGSKSSGILHFSLRTIFCC